MGPPFQNECTNIENHVVVKCKHEWKTDVDSDETDVYGSTLFVFERLVCEGGGGGEEGRDR